VFVTAGWFPTFVVDVAVDDPLLDVAEDDAETETLAAEAVSPSKQAKTMMNTYLIGFSRLCVQRNDATNRIEIPR
jgi:hypothetical protein